MQRPCLRGQQQGEINMGGRFAAIPYKNHGSIPVPRNQFPSPTSEATHSTQTTMDERKARLRALAAKAGRLREEPSKESDADCDGQANDPENIDHGTSAASSTSIPTTERPYKKSKMNNANENIPSEALTRALEDAKDDVATAIPEGSSENKKIDWDLKRDIQPKLDKLEKRYQRSLIKILKQKLEQEAAAVAATDG